MPDKKFTVTTDPSQEDMELIKRIMGHPGNINGVPIKECFCCMTKHNSVATYKRITSLQDIQKVISSAKPCDSVYMSFNSFVHKAYRFGMNAALQVHNICIDIDWHASSPDEACAAANALAEDLGCQYTRKHYELPKPGAMCFTGRGVQIFFFLRHAPFKMGFLVKKIAVQLCKRLNNLLEDSPLTYNGYSIDTAASERAGGLCRVPGTINPETGYRSQAIILDTSYWDIVKLAERVGIKYTPKKAGKRQKKNISPTARTFAMIQLIEDAARSGNYLSREVLTHVCHSYMLSRGLEGAAEEAWALNKMFPEPLPEQEIRDLIRCDEAHNYRYSEKGIFKKTGIPGEQEFFEQWPTNKKKGGGNKARDTRCRKARIAWHNEIRELYAEGLSPSEIAKTTGRDIRTVRKYIGTPLETMDEQTDEQTETDEQTDKQAETDEQTDKQADAKRAVSLYKHGFRQKAIAAIMEINNVDELLADYLKYREQRRKKIFAMWRLKVIKNQSAKDPLFVSLRRRAKELSCMLYHLQPWDDRCPDILKTVSLLDKELKALSEACE